VEAMSVTQSKINPQTYSRLVAKARPAVIKTEEENNRMLAIVEQLMKKGDNLTAEEGELLELLSNLISNFEDKHYPIKEPTPLEMLQHLMEARALTAKDLWDVFGSKGVTSEVLNGKRGISRTHIKKLAAFFNVSPELFI
jgi:HTH-type transcriptional regulator/antitoxin HigA